MNNQRSAQVTLWANRILFLFMIALAVLMPLIADRYGKLIYMPERDQLAICIAYWICLCMILPALWNIDKLLRNILRQNVFVTENVACLRRVRWFALGVALVCFPAGNFFMPLYCLSVMMLFLFFAVSVLKDVMAAAVEIREENDLTI